MIVSIWNLPYSLINIICKTLKRNVISSSRIHIMLVIRNSQRILLRFPCAVYEAVGTYARSENSRAAFQAYKID